jgi:hypothetical protein
MATLNIIWELIFLDAPGFEIFMIMYSLALTLLVIYLLYWLIVKIGTKARLGLTNKQQKTLLAGAIAIMVLLTALFPYYRGYMGEREMIVYGFPLPFLTLYSDATAMIGFLYLYFISIETIINVLIPYLCLLVLYKLYLKIKNLQEHNKVV